MAFDIPILFIVFNRPDKTLIVFNKLRQLKPKRLFIAADGPRPSKEGEKERCEAVRLILTKGVDWDCDVQIRFSDINLGCGKNESSAMLWFFEAVGEGIVIEDDTLPDPSFFHFCKDLLAYYRNDESIRMIGGNNFQNGKLRGDGSYYFSNITHSWGYASWWRAWKDYDFELKSFDEFSIKELIERKFSRSEEREYWMKVYYNMRAGIYDTWDYQFLFKMWENNGKCIIPNKNLVTNIGFGNNATHTVNKDDPAANLPLGKIEKIVHPTSKKIHGEADRYFFNHIIMGNQNLLTRIKGKIKRVVGV